MKRDIEELAWIFKSLGYAKRLQIINALIVKGPLTVSAIAEETKAPYTAVSQNLAILGRTGFVTSRRSGHHVIYRIKTAQFSPRRMFLLWMIINSVRDSKDESGLENLVSSVMSGDYKKFLRSIGPC